ncbi:glucose-6-phosphate dehydrogenase [Portibacter lacus]|uniref:Glucose-6-phosphate 1-dehydrogenase n=1 Tax=Portibacter lacus TaxID=1099794 RepID=A0AA37SZC1_9BACT|nr:glucose-6-phosphate dehydrogenase [Portibacter lacus]GLR20195.1 glucose-6-phosphate 1-dehydrogenase [Portibacter lacus]
MNKIDDQILVIFGASGDLTARKLIPALYHLCKGEYLPKNFIVLGASRTDMTDEEFRNRVITESKFFKDEHKSDKACMEDFASKLFYQDLGGDYNSSYEPVKQRLLELSKEHDIPENYIFYLSTPPSIYINIANNLSAVGLTDQSNGWKRLVVEKPFGYDLKSAKKLNKGLLKCFNEHQIYRIDHYLGKETVQNLLVTRFSNSIFEPLWNKNYISHVEITNAESEGVGSRGGYYDGSGAFRDMFQNHLMQIVSLVAMEPPYAIEANAIREEKLKVLKCLKGWTPSRIRRNTVRAQYAANDGMKGYKEEDGVPEKSKTETYAAIKFYFENWRWEKVPFFVRTAKRMPAKVTEVIVHFKPSPKNLFDGKQENNKLIIRIQPNEGIMLNFGMKLPGQGFSVENVDMDFNYSDLSEDDVPEAYERLLLDVMQGDATLYALGAEVEEAWAFVDPVLEAWKNDKDIELHQYKAGTWGPKAADKLLGKFDWRDPTEDNI